jgi:hypothetical protein
MLRRRGPTGQDPIRRYITYIVVAVLLIGLAMLHKINTSWGFSFTDYERPLVFKKQLTRKPKFGNIRVLTKGA